MLDHKSAAIPIAAPPTSPAASNLEPAVGAAAPGLEDDEAALPEAVFAGAFVPVAPPPVSVTPFETVISLFDGFVCGGVVLLGKAEERNPEVVVPEADAEDSAGEVLAAPEEL